MKGINPQTSTYAMNPKDKYEYCPTEDERIAIFVASCVESVAKALNVAPGTMYQRMARIGLIKDYIIPCYNVLHTESRQHVTEDLIKTIEIWEKKQGVAI